MTLRVGGVENQGQLYVPEGPLLSLTCNHDTDLSLEMLSALSEVGDLQINQLGSQWPRQLTLKIKVTNIRLRDLCYLCLYTCYRRRSWWRFQHSRGRGFQINQNKSLDLEVWPWKLRSTIYEYDWEGQPSRYPWFILVYLRSPTSRMLKSTWWFILYACMTNQR